MFPVAVLLPLDEAGVVLEFGVERIPLSTPNGVRGGDVTHGLQSKYKVEIDVVLV